MNHSHVAARTRRSTLPRLVPLLLAALCATTPLAATAQSADLVINIADNPDPGPAGGIFTYTIRVDDNGPSAATGVTLGASLPPGVTFVDVVTTQGSCSTASLPAIDCTLGSLAFLGSATVTVRVILPAAQVYTLTASTTATTPDGNTSNNNASETTTAVEAADMKIAVSAPTGPLPAGTPFNYTVATTNQGPYGLDASDTQTITFDVPAGACVTAAPTGTGWACVAPAGGYPACGGQTISCTHAGPLAVGASAPALTVPAASTTEGSVTGQFDVSSTLPDGNPADNTAGATTEFTGDSSDLSIRKTASPSVVAVGANVTYTLTPRFEGGTPPGALPPNLITVTDTLPANVTYVSASGSGWTCDTGSLPLITCTMPGPYTGGNYTNLPAITIVATATAPGSISNTAQISGPESDPVPDNNTSTIGVTASNNADLHVTKTASLNPLVPGQAFTYTLHVTNGGPLAVAAGQTITITDPLPAGLTLTALPSGTGWTCASSVMPLPAAAPLTITCTHAGPLAVNASAPNITVPVTIDGTAAIDSLANTACATLSGTGPESGTTANCGTSTVFSTTTSADLAIAKSVSPDPVKAGQDLTYTLVVSNAGPDAATNVTVTDVLQSLVATGSLQSVTVSPAGGSCSPAAPANGTSITLTCNLGTLAASDAVTVTVVVRPSIATTGARSNTATVRSPDVGDPDPSNNSSTASGQVTAVADMTVSKTASPNPVRGGTPLTYVLAAKNNGPSTAQAVHVVDTLPTNAVWISLGTITGGGTCTAPAAGALGGTLTCDWTSIPNNTQRTVTYVVRPLATAAGTNAVNSAVVSTTTEESDTGNNSTTIATPITAASLDILVNKVDSVDPIPLGATTRYTITIHNAGPSFGTNVTMVDTFPSGGTPTATFSYQGNLAVTPPDAGACTEPAVGVTAGTLSCAFPGLEAGAQILVQYDMRAETITGLGITGTSFNTVSVAVDEPETQSDNNTATNATTTRRTADLAIVKTAPSAATAGDTFTYTLTVTNNGPNASTGATVADVLPAGVSFAGASGGCVNASGTVTCTLGTLASGASTAMTITVLVSNPYTGAVPLANAATVTAVNEVDPVPDNNTGGTTTTIVARNADLSLVKTAPASVVAGQLLTYTLTVANSGPDSSSGAVITDVLPTGVRFASASDGCDNAAGTVTCTPGTIAAGSSTAVTITVRINDPYDGAQPLVNAAHVETQHEADPDPGNNDGSASTHVQSAPPAAVPAITLPALAVLVLLMLVAFARALAARRALHRR
ncbi:MAG: DUF11 domain-containing protein [Proteobacteria bacterium]|nr:DUF11 domain-containing protein [Pseudomonadota bacterium]